MDTSKEAYKAKMEAQLKLWSARFDGMKAKADKASAGAKIELLKQVEELKALEGAAKKHIAEVEASATDAWHTAKEGIERRWNQLSGSIEALWNKIAPDAAPKGRSGAAPKGPSNTV